MALVAQGCADDPMQDQLDAIGARQAAADERLAQTTKLVTEAEERLRVAEKSAARAECRATVMSIGAEAAETSARCALQHAEVAECKARAAKAAADSTLVGCVLGLGAAAATGGAAVGVAAAGCGLGRALGDDSSGCGEAQCDSSSRHALQQALATRAIPSLPMCGGAVGMEIESVSKRGLVVKHVVPDSTAAGMGVFDGDILLKVAGRPIRAPEDIGTALGNVSEGETFEVSIYRQDQRHELSGTRWGNTLGVQHESQIVLVPDAYSKVVSVQEGSPGALAGLEEGDVLISMGAARAVSNRDSVQGAYRLIEEGQSIAVAFERRGRLRTTELVLGPRTTPDAL